MVSSNRSFPRVASSRSCRLLTVVPPRVSRGSKSKASKHRRQESRDTADKAADEVELLRAELSEARRLCSEQKETIENLRVEVAVAQLEAADALEECARQTCEADKEITFSRGLLEESRAQEIASQRTIIQQREAIGELERQVDHYKQAHKEMSEACAEAKTYQNKVNKALITWNVRENKNRLQMSALKKENSQLSYAVVVSKGHEERLADILRISLKEVSRLRLEIATRDQQLSGGDVDDDDETVCGSPRMGTEALGFSP